MFATSAAITMTTPSHRKNGEFDVALELADGYAIYEAKYYAQPMTLDEIHREAQQVANIKELAVKHSDSSPQWLCGAGKALYLS